VTQARTPPRLVIVGNDGGTNVGASLVRAARAVGCDVTLVDARDAYAAPRVVARLNWWLRGRRPTRLAAFSRHVLDVCTRVEPGVLLATGIAPIDRPTLDALSSRGIQTIDYLTDDPWNPAFRSAWFLAALPAYHHVFSVRTRNLDDLRRHGCADVRYLPFGVDLDLFFPEPPPPSEIAAYRTDVCFAGGADRDRAPIVGALSRGGLSVSLYGDYWDRFPETRALSRGHAAPDVLRKAASGAAVSLCLVRRANRDGHTMRSFEVPAVGGCMLAEDTEEHRRFFGSSGQAVTFFRDTAEMLDRARHLIASPAERERLARAGHEVIRHGAFTYHDRLVTMLDLEAAS
jgi:hypothetical protein